MPLALYFKASFAIHFLFAFSPSSLVLDFLIYFQTVIDTW